MIDHRPMARPFLLTFLLGATVLLIACGQLVTPEATQVLPPADTSTPTATAPTVGSTNEAPSISMLDTATPTITPTPIVHVVQQGDTLQAIAFDFGVSVDALQRANGIENPQFLQVGQHLVIPIHEESDQTTTGLLLPTPTPHPIRVQGVAFYETPVDSLIGLGEVVNTTVITLTNVQIQVTLLNAAGEPLIKTDMFIAMDVLLPGERSPFTTLFTTPPPDWVSYQVTVIRAQEAGALARAYTPLAVTELDAGPEGSQFQVNGVVANAAAGRVVETVDIFVTTYDAQGRVTGFRCSALLADAGDRVLPPGGEMTFSLSLTAHGEVPHEVTVAALGHTADGPTSGG